MSLTEKKRLKLVERYAELHKNGQLSEAAKGYTQILEDDPENHNASQLLGAVYHQQGKLQQAEQIYLKALEHKRRDPALLSNYGSLLLARGEKQKAVEYFSASLDVDPEFFDALRNRGIVYEQQGELLLAIRDYSKCAKLKPATYDIWVHMGLCQTMINLHHQAASSFCAAIAIEPGHHQAYCKYGELLMKLGLFNESKHFLSRAIQLNSHFLKARYSFAECHFLGHDYITAVQVLEDLIAIANDSSVSPTDKVSDWSNRSVLTGEQENANIEKTKLAAMCMKAKGLVHLGRREAAIQITTEVINRREDDVDALSIRCKQLMAIKNFAAAEKDLLRLIALGEAEKNPLILGDYLIGLRGSFKWDTAAAIEKTVLGKLGSGEYCIMPFHLLSISDSAKLQQLCGSLHKRTLDGLYSLGKKSPDFPSRAKVRDKGEKLRIAYISPDFRHHPVTFLTKGIFEHHDRSRFEVICVSLYGAKDAETAEVANTCDQWIDATGKDGGSLLQVLRNLDLDIAVDLAGYTGRARTTIFAQKVAPIQINFLGYPGTMGKPFMDYMIGDSFTVPESTQQYYSEKIIYIEPCFQPNDSSRENRIVKLSKKALGLPEDKVIFCCNNRPEKISWTIFEAWLEILKQVPESCLWILGIGKEQRALLQSILIKHGVDQNRLIASPRIPYAENLSRMKNADLMLDTFPFNGGTSTSEALWTGVPVLTLTGEAFASRMSGSLLIASGLEGLICDSSQDYIEKAVQLAQHPEQIASFKKHIKRTRNKLPLFDTGLYTQKLEQAYEEIVLRSRAGFKPQHIRTQA